MAPKKVNLLDVAKAEYQAEVATAAAALELQAATREYQQAMIAEFERQSAPASAATIPGKKQKVRAKYPASEGKSPNGFSMKMVTGQIDAAMVEFHKQNRQWPTAEVVARLIDAPTKRVQEHIDWWREIGNAKRGNLYL